GVRRDLDRPLVQISSSARRADRRTRGTQRAGGIAQRRAPRAQHTSDYGGAVRRAGGGEPESLSLAAFRSRRDQLAGLADSNRGILLQNLHVAGGVLGEALRAADP